jgi:DNA-binding transcriptional MerR regulator
MKIGELAARSGITAKAIRFYEQAGVLPEPGRTPGGYRDYGEDFVERLEFVRRAQAAGLTLKQAGQILAVRDGGQAPCEHVQDLLARRLAEVRAHIAELVTLEQHLQALLDNAHSATPAAHDAAGVCWILEADV